MRTLTRVQALLLAASLLPLSQVLFPGCATMMNGPRQEIRMRSEPAGAEVYLNGRKIGVTPTAAFVSRWGMHRVKIAMSGYRPYEVKLEKAYNETASANAFIGGVWIVVDAVTGAIFEQRVPAAARDPEARKLIDREMRMVDFNPPLFVVTHLKPDVTARKIGQMQRR